MKPKTIEFNHFQFCGSCYNCNGRECGAIKIGKQELTKEKFIKRYGEKAWSNLLTDMNKSVRPLVLRTEAK